MRPAYHNDKKFVIKVKMPSLYNLFNVIIPVKMDRNLSLKKATNPLSDKGFVASRYI